MLLKTLSEIPGVSGDEGKIRAAIKEKAAGYADKIYTDSMGNLIVYKAPHANQQERPKVMISAHMDEVGLIIHGIEKSGHLRFLKVGDIDDRVLVSKTVAIGPDNIPGVIGAKAIHLQKPKERNKALPTKDLYIDIGAKDREEAESIINLGDYAVFNTATNDLGNGYITGKALDNRVGCCVLLDLIQKNWPFSLFAVFTAQEETGSRGAVTAAYQIDPDWAIVVETTMASDYPELKDKRPATTLGKGPALTLMDGSFIGDKQVLKLLKDAAEENNLDYQYRKFTGGFTDAGAISLSKEGVRAGVVSIPCRYLHSPVSLLQMDDYHATVQLVGSALEKLTTEEVGS